MGYREYGFVSLRKQSGKWRAVVGYCERDEDGEIIRRGQTSTILKVSSNNRDNRGKDTAKKLANEFKAKLEEEEPIRAKQDDLTSKKLLPKNPTVSQYIDYYLDHRLPLLKTVEPSTMNGYRRYAGYIAKSWGGVCIGNVRLTKLRNMQIEEWRNQISKKIAPITVKSTLALLNRSLKQAVADDVLKKNPAEKVDPPTQDNKKPNWIDAPERVRLGEALDNILSADSPDHCRRDGDVLARKSNALAIKLALLTGMRQGEICGLRWRSVAPDFSFLRVELAIGRDGNATYIKAPKTEKGIRTVDIGEALANDLREQKKRMRKTAKAYGLVWSEDMFVFGEPRWDDSTDSWHYLKPKRLGKVWQCLVREMDLRAVNGGYPSFHDMRHTFATAAAYGGMDKHSLKSEIGHSSISVTEQYYVGEDAIRNREEMLKIQELILAQVPESDKVLDMRPTGTEA